MTKDEWNLIRKTLSDGELRCHNSWKRAEACDYYSHNDMQEAEANGCPNCDVSALKGKLSIDEDT